jgi:hypothetical protein
MKSVYLDDLDIDGLDRLVAHSKRMTSLHSLVTLQHYGGALSRVEPGETAYSYRNAEFAVTISAAWTNQEEDDDHVAWSRDFYTTLLPLSRGFT